MAVDTRGGTPIRISDIGRVVIGNAVRLGRVGRTDTDVKGYPGGIKDEDDVAEGIVIMRRGENPVEVCERVKRMADEINAHYLPAGVRLVTYYDRTALVDRTLHTVRHNVIEGIGLVLLVLFFFLGLGNWRSALVVALAVPVALLGAFMLLDLRGIPANLISLGAIDFGIIVDSAVVVIENILRILEQRKGQVRSLRAVIIEAVSQMGRPILFSKAILLTAFVPLYTLQRVEGRIFRPMALTLTFALITGTVFAITAVPVLASFALRRKVAGDESWIVGRLLHVYRPALDFALRSRRVVFGVAAALLVARRGHLPFHRQRIPAEAGRGRPLGAHLRPAVDLPFGVGQDHRERPAPPRLVPRGEVRRQPARPPRRRHRRQRVGRDRVQRRPEAPGGVDDRPRPTTRSSRPWPRSLREIPGIDTQFSQYIEDNVDEAVSGVKSELAIKLFGDDPVKLQDYANQIVDVIKTVPGAADVGHQPASRPAPDPDRRGPRPPSRATACPSPTSRP